MKTTSSKQTQEYGKKLAGTLRGGEVLAFSGELGAGKTTLIQGIAQGLGITQPITSPTFLLMRVYQLPKPKNGIAQLVHIDCYRIYSEQEIEDIGAVEYFGREDTVVLVEWPERIKKLLPRHTKTIMLELGKEENKRMIKTT